MIHRDLCHVVSSELSWTSQYCHISTRVNYPSYCTCTFVTPLPFIYTKKLLCFTLVCPKIICCSPVQQSNYIKDIVALERTKKQTTIYVVYCKSFFFKVKYMIIFSPNLHLLNVTHEINDIVFFP